MSLQLQPVLLPEHPDMDLILIHGMGTTAEAAWSHPSVPGSFWPQWLPTNPDLRGVRVHCIKYPDLGGKESFSNIGMYGQQMLDVIKDSPDLFRANTPIVLLGHGLGGLVVKSMFERSLRPGSPAVYREITERIRDLMFFSTPQKDCDSQDLVKKMIRHTAQESVSIEGTPEITASTAAFCQALAQRAEQVGVWSFYDMIKVPRELSHRELRSDVVVGPKRGSLDWPYETKVPLHATYAFTARFDSARSPLYKQVQNVIRFIVDGL